MFDLHYATHRDEPDDSMCRYLCSTTIFRELQARSGENESRRVPHAVDVRRRTHPMPYGVRPRHHDSRGLTKRAMRSTIKVS